MNAISRRTNIQVLLTISIQLLLDMLFLCSPDSCFPSNSSKYFSSSWSDNDNILVTYDGILSRSNSVSTNRHPRDRHTWTQRYTLAVSPRVCFDHVANSWQSQCFDSASRPGTGVGLFDDT